MTVEADTAEEGIRLALTTWPALVLMDIQLPGMTGIEALQHLRADPRTRDPGDRGDGLGDDPGPPEDHGGGVSTATRSRLSHGLLLGPGKSTVEQSIAWAHVPLCVSVT